MEFSFGGSRWVTDEEIANNTEIAHKDFGLGLHIPGRFDKILDVNRCHLQVDSANEILTLCRNKALELGVPAYNQKTHEGFLRNLMIRSTLANSEILALLITNTPKNEAEENYLKWFSNDLISLAPQITNLGTAINDTKSPVTIKNIKFYHGKDYISEKILGVEYQISPTSFFQTNSFHLDGFIGEIIDYAGDISEKVVWDLYCGTGSITLPTAKRCKEIYGIELVESSITDAKANAERNQISNAEFFCADLHLKETPELLEKLPSPDVIIIDPPRAGMHKNLIPHILQANAKTIVYVSCNPATQARDCELLSEKYEVRKVQPVDMFPHTYHVESIALLERKEG
jgi:23S rRNA (uracil1939-C5)-methyltransferase